MRSLRSPLLLGGLLLGSCSLLVQNLGVARCDTEGQLLCADGVTLLECLGGLEKLTPCDDGEGCVEDDGCVQLCGNDLIDDGEDCDSDDLNGQNCAEVTGFPNGNLACDNDACVFDTSACFGCGDGVANADEECDDGNNDDNDGCDSACELEDPAVCLLTGNANDLEFCDGNDLVGKSCVDFGFVGGTLDCNDNCGFDTDECTRP